MKKRNEQIAKMLGFTQRSYGSFKLWEFNGVPAGELDFHYDWNWLMKAVEFIENLHKGNAYGVEIGANHCEIFTYTQFALAHDIDVEIYHKKKSKIEAVFYVVSDFAKTYSK